MVFERGWVVLECRCVCFGGIGEWGKVDCEVGEELGVFYG